jgi:iron(III) transport system permease protein
MALNAAVQRLLIRAAPVRHRSGLLVVGSLLVVLGILVLYPIALLAINSVQSSRYGANVTWTLGHYVTLLTSRDSLAALQGTVLISGGATAVAAFWGVLLAWIIARTDTPGRRMLDTLNLIPFFLSSTVAAVGWQVLIAPRAGMINQLYMHLTGRDTPLLNVYSYLGNILVIGFFYTPYMYLFVVGALHNLDPAMEEAARVSGASMERTTFLVTLPLVLPSILSGIILVFVTAASLIGVPILLAVPGRIHTLATRIWQATQDYPPDYNFAATISMLLLVLTLGLLAMEWHAIRGRAFVTVSGRGYRPGIIKLGRWRYIALGLDLLYFMISVVLPFGALVLASFQDQWLGTFEPTRFTWDNYRQVLFADATAVRGLRNSLILATVGSTIAVSFCALVAYITRRTKTIGVRLVELIATAPVALPGIVLGIAFLIAWIRTPLYGTLWIIMIAYVAHYLPYGVKNLSAILGSIAPELEESARVSGARPWTVLYRVTLPLIRPGIVATWLLLFVIFLREVGASIILYVTGTETMSISLIRIMQYSPYALATAFSVLQTLLLLILLMVFNRIAGARWLVAPR